MVLPTLDIFLAKVMQQVLTEGAIQAISKCL